MNARVKVCGVRTPEDAEAAANAGVDAVGINFVPGSPRFLGSFPAALQIAQVLRAKGVQGVAVFANPTLSQVAAIVRELEWNLVQLHGEEPPEFGRSLREKLRLNLWKAFRVSGLEDLGSIQRQDWPCDAMLLDAKGDGSARGGTGKTFDWTLLRGFSRSKALVLAGGLNPGNVAEAIREVRPDWVDTASGVESAPGKKDPDLMRRFVQEARKAAKESRPSKHER